jgi:DNA-binding CsgD family transcriptional regulator
MSGRRDPELSRSESLRLSDLDAALRLLNELRDLPAADPAARERHLLTGMCQLIGARVGVAGTYRNALPGCQPGMVAAADVGLEDDERRAAARYFQTGDPPDPVHAPLFQARQRPLVTFRREELLPDGAWYKSAHFNEIRRPARLDHHIHSKFYLPDRPGWVKGIGLHRTNGERAFSARERGIVAVLHARCDWLYAADPSFPPVPPPDPRVLALPPRVREALNHLLVGRSLKEVAARMKLSRNTVHGYVKILHQRFGVSSRGELLAAVLRPAGNGGNGHAGDGTADLPG